MENCFNIIDFGAIADNQTDNTNAIQLAIDEASKVSGCVLIPPGKYKCGKLSVKSNITLMGFHGWGYRDIGGSVLVLNDENAECLLDLTGAHGVCVKGLQLIGEYKGENIHGIMIKWELYNGNGETFWDGYTTNFHEDSTVIEDCQIREFSGDAIHLNHIFAFTIRNSHCIHNHGNGIYIDGWDGWINNTILSFNDKYGLMGENACSAITTIGNRVEWNKLGGYYFESAGSNIISSSSFDRNMGPAVHLSSKVNYRRNFVITSNIFNRNGKPRKTPFNSQYENSHIFIEKAHSVVISQNTFQTGIDDGGGGILSPDYGIAYKTLTNSLLTQNSIYDGSVRDFFVDLGENENNIIKDNI